MFGSAYGGANQPFPPKPNDLVVNCECTLEELYEGCMKKVNYERNVLGLDGKSNKPQKQEMEVEIKPGYQEGEIMRFPGKGHESCGYSNCIF